MAADVILRGGTIYDGLGGPPVVGDVALRGDRIAEVGPAGTLSGVRVLDADGLAVAPGFINTLSWASESLLLDGRSMSDIAQGVTLEVMGEGVSMGPLNDALRREMTWSHNGQHMGDTLRWTTLDEYLRQLETQGVSTNVASFVGSSTLRAYVMGYEDRPATPAEISAMSDLLAQALREGAVGLSAALIYPPATYSSTDELIALARVVAQVGGLYISHIRGEGTTVHDALDEFCHIVQTAQVRGEIYHLKVAGRTNWHKMTSVVARIEEARAEGLPITADMYPYAASGTGLDSCLPPWAHEGGREALLARLADPAIRPHLLSAMQASSDEWENMFFENLPENILLAGFHSAALKRYTGWRLADVVAERGTSPAETVLDLLLEDRSRIATIYFSMTEENLRLGLARPWVSICSDSASLAPELPFTDFHVHPRAYGSFARVLGLYSRDEKLFSLAEAVRRMTSLPAANLGLTDRGRIAPGYHADLAIFDPQAVQDRATFTQPHQLAEGMVHVFVNGVPVWQDGTHTGQSGGRVVRGPGTGR